MAAKVNFNHALKIIEVTLAPELETDDSSGSGQWVIDIDVKVDIYSDGKEDWLTDATLNKFLFPVRAIGGQELPGEKALGTTFFLDYGWRIRPYEGTHVLRVNGNLYTEEGDSPFVQTIGSYNVMVINSVSSLVDSTVQQLAEIEYASFDNGVTVDIDNGESGTEYPVGTRKNPVNNFIDALSIASTRGFKILYILGDATIDGSNDFSNFEIIGESAIKTTLVISALANTSGCEFLNATITGTLDGENYISNCIVVDLTYVNGSIFNCGLIGEIILAGGLDAVLNDCFTVDQDDPPVIDMGGSGQSLAMPNYSGTVTMKNLTDSDKSVGIGLNSGMVILESSITAGTVIISGIGILTNNSTASVNTDGLMSKQTITEISWHSVYVDTDLGSSGTAFPLGTTSSPVDNMDDAKTIAIANNIWEFDINGDVTLPSAFEKYSFRGRASNTTSIDINGQSVDQADFENCTLIGEISGEIRALNCAISNGMTGLKGYFINGFVLGTVKFAATGACILKGVSSGGPTGAVIDMDGAGTMVAGINLTGIWTLKNTTSPPPNIAQLEFDSGTLILDSSCTGGIIGIAGIVTVNDNAGSECIITRDGQIEASPGAYREKILIDVDNGFSGTSYPLGTTGYPVNNIADAKIIADNNKIKQFNIYGNITLEESFEEYIFIGHNPHVSSIDLNNQTISHSTFKKINIIGSGVGHFEAEDCTLLAGFTNINVTLTRGDVDGTFTIAEGGSFMGDGFTADTQTFVVDLNGAGNFGASNFSGVMTIANGTDPTCTFSLTGYYLLTIMDTCTAGLALIAGVGILNDYSTGMTIIEKTLPSSVWEESNAEFLLKAIKNKKALTKTGSEWQLILYDDDNVTPIMNKAIKDKDGNNITDLEAGTLAQELKTSI